MKMKKIKRKDHSQMSKRGKLVSWAGYWSRLITFFFYGLFPEPN